MAVMNLNWAISCEMLNKKSTSFRDFSYWKNANPLIFSNGRKNFPFLSLNPAGKPSSAGKNQHSMQRSLQHDGMCIFPFRPCCEFNHK